MKQADLTPRQRWLAQMTPSQWQSQVMAWAEMGGWLCYHTYDSRRSVAGFPDVILLRDGKLIAAELKTGRGVLTREQHIWLDAFAQAGVEVHEWRPENGDQIRDLLLSGMQDLSSRASIQRLFKTKTPARRQVRRGPPSTRKGISPRDATQ